MPHVVIRYKTLLHVVIRYKTYQTTPPVTLDRKQNLYNWRAYHGLPKTESVPSPPPPPFFFFFIFACLCTLSSWRSASDIQPIPQHLSRATAMNSCHSVLSKCGVKQRALERRIEELHYEAVFLPPLGAVSMQKLRAPLLTIQELSNILSF